MKTPKFQEYMLNEIYKLKGDAIKLTLEERLNCAYKIIKSNMLIYNKFEKNGFFKSFIMATRGLVFSNDNSDIIDLIDFSYIVLKDKIDCEEEYFNMKREIIVVKEENKKTFRRIL